MGGVVADTFVEFTGRVVVNVLAAVVGPEAVVERSVITPVCALQTLGFDSVTLHFHTNNYFVFFYY